MKLLAFLALAMPLAVFSAPIDGEVAKKEASPDGFGDYGKYGDGDPDEFRKHGHKHSQQQQAHPCHAGELSDGNNGHSKLHRAVGGLLLQGVTALMRGHTHRGDGLAMKVLGR